MDTKTVAHIIRKHVEKMQDFGEDISKAPDKEAIHEFRVHTKKLRALLRLLSFSEDERFRLPDKFKDLYAVSGEIRDAQLMEDKLQEVSLPEMTNWLKEHLKDSYHSWRKHHEEKVLDQLEEKLSDEDYPSLSTDALTAFFEDRIHEVRKIVAAGKFSDELLHDIRKLLKDLQYIAATCKDEWEKGYEVLLHYDPDRLHELTDMIGSYNDLRNALDWLVRYEDETYTIRDKEELLKTQLHWLEEKLQQKETLVSALVKAYPAR